MKIKNYSMKSIALLFVASMSLFTCSNETLPDSQTEAASMLQESAKTSSKKTSDTRLHFTTNLSGANEVPPNGSKATGQAIVTISKDESTIHYKLITANIENVRFSHFHMAPVGVNGGVVVTLYVNPNEQPSGPANGILAEGDVTAEDITGSLAGDMPGLIDAMRNGLIYVNVHTFPTFGGGEIRGQL
ncbi:CHRD domain-containing protein [Mariniflexile sp. HMF6888]|uniref:CHRD domain-containing protein n=1 Tax=Mariniflexile sp. HMF6888 TaxID=3373086 RepID=UPI0037B7AF2A